jgi:transposase InsO family protein
MILRLLAKALEDGAEQGEACQILGVDETTVQRWRRQPGGADRRAGPIHEPKNKLAPAEYAEVRAIVTSPEFRDLAPSQIVPRLADQGIYVASESTIYRILRKEEMQHHRGTSRPPRKRHRPREHRATGPNQVWSWDITYLRSPVKGMFFYLYVAIDVWSRKIVGWTIEVSESPEHSSRFLAATCAREGVEPGQLVIHSDNGGPMKGATLLATLQALGVATSFSRPSVSNDNPFSESNFSTMKCRPAFPDGPFKSIEDARAWMTAFVRWYNTEHRHSGIRFVTPEERHSGRQAALLERRKVVYAKARAARPERWARSTRNWEPIEEVVLNPAPADQETRVA